MIFHWLIFSGVTVYQPETVRCNISPGINEACVSGTNFSNNCDTMASNNEHGCVLLVWHGPTSPGRCDILLALFPCVDLDRYGTVFRCMAKK